MSVQVGRCYYHPDKASVAVCAKCGVGICEECTVIGDDGRAICYQCGNEALRQEHKEYRRLLKERGGRFVEGRDFLVPAIVGIILILVAGALAYREGYIGSRGAELVGFSFAQYIGKGGSTALYIVFLALCAYFLFSIPFCYVLIDDLFASKYRSFSNRISHMITIFLISYFVGWIVFTFVWIRFLVRKGRAKE